MMPGKREQMKVYQSRKLTVSRCLAKADALWKSLCPDDKDELQAFTESNHSILTIPSRVSNDVDSGKLTEASNLIAELFEVEDKPVTQFILMAAYADGIESACPASEQGNVLRDDGR